MEVEEDGGSRAPGVAVAFVPPPRGARESLSSCEDGSLGVYSDDDEEDLPYPGFLALTWGCLFQNTVPRNYCLAMLTNPYPFIIHRPPVALFGCALAFCRPHCCHQSLHHPHRLRHHICQASSLRMLADAITTAKTILSALDASSGEPSRRPQKVSTATRTAAPPTD